MPRPRKVDKLRAIELRRGGATYPEIAAIQGVSPQAICKSIKDLLPTDDTKTYKAHRADILARMQHEILASVGAQAIKDASLLQRVTAAGILIDKERLERGQATEMIAHGVALSPPLMELLDRIVGPQVDRQYPQDMVSEASQDPDRGGS